MRARRGGGGGEGGVGWGGGGWGGGERGIWEVTANPTALSDLDIKKPPRGGNLWTVREPYRDRPDNSPNCKGYYNTCPWFIATIFERTGVFYGKKGS